MLALLLLLMLVQRTADNETGFYCLSIYVFVFRINAVKTPTQGRSDGGGISYIYSPKSVYLTNFYVVTGCFFFLFDPGQNRYRASVRLSSCFFYVLTHHNLYPPNEIPVYAPAPTRCIFGANLQYFAPV